MIQTSKLFYFGTNIEVCLGDIVRVRKGLFRREVNGRVTYIPGQSPLHPEMEADGLRYWSLSLEEGTVLSWVYLPNKIQPSRSIRFIERGDPICTLKITDELK